MEHAVINSCKMKEAKQCAPFLLLLVVAAEKKRACLAFDIFQNGAHSYPFFMMGVENFTLCRRPLSFIFHLSGHHPIRLSIGT